MRRLRRFLPDEVYFVTIRTIEQRFALDPHGSPNAWLEAERRQLDDESRIAMNERGQKCVMTTDSIAKAIAWSELDPENPRIEVPISTFTDSILNIIGSVVARAVRRYDVHLYGFAFMSNHIHMLLQAPLGNLAQFMTYVNGQLAVNINRFLGRTGPLWSRRYSAAQVLDEAEELDKLAYILANPYHAGLAGVIENCPSLSSASFLFKKAEYRFLCFDRTSWHNKGRPENIAPFLSTVKLDHRVLPQLQGIEIESLPKKLPNLPNAIAKMAVGTKRKKHLESGLSVRRQLLLRTVIPTDRPESAKSTPRKRSPQPLCHTSNPMLRQIYQEWDREFRLAYKEASKHYRNGHTNVEFPTGAFAPSKYPLARHARDPDANEKMLPTRRNLELAALMTSLTQ